MSAPQLQRARRVLRGLSIALALFVVLELGLRAFGFRFTSLDPPLRIWNAVEDRQMEEETSLHRFNGYSLWEPRPFATIPWDTGEQVNAETFRGPILPRERTPGRLRVATLGDSSTFGLGVAWKDCWSAVLQQRLRDSGVDAEVLDGGVIGFTSLQGLARYVERVRPYRPDIVVAAFGAVNEHNAGNVGRPDPVNIANSVARQTFAYRSVRALRDASRVVQLVDLARCEMLGLREKKLAEWKASQRKVIPSSEDVGSAEWTGVRRLSPAQFTQVLRDLRRAVEADGAKLVLVSMPRVDGIEEQRPALTLYTQGLESLAHSDGIPLADAHARFIAEHRDDPKAPLFLPNDAWHPTPRGHALIADCVLPLVVPAKK